MPTPPATLARQQQRSHELLLNKFKTFFTTLTPKDKETSEILKVFHQYIMTMAVLSDETVTIINPELILHKKLFTILKAISQSKFKGLGEPEVSQLAESFQTKFRSKFKDPEAITSFFYKMFRLILINYYSKPLHHSLVYNLPKTEINHSILNFIHGAPASKRAAQALAESFNTFSTMVTESILPSLDTASIFLTMILSMLGMVLYFFLDHLLVSDIEKDSLLYYVSQARHIFLLILTPIIFYLNSRKSTTYSYLLLDNLKSLPKESIESLMFIFAQLEKVTAPPGPKSPKMALNSISVPPNESTYPNEWDLTNAGSSPPKPSKKNPEETPTTLVSLGHPLLDNSQEIITWTIPDLLVKECELDDNIIVYTGDLTSPILQLFSANKTLMPKAKHLFIYWSEHYIKQKFTALPEELLPVFFRLGVFAQLVSEIDKQGFKMLRENILELKQLAKSGSHYRIIFEQKATDGRNHLYFPTQISND